MPCNGCQDLIVAYAETEADITVAVADSMSLTPVLTIVVPPSDDDLIIVGIVNVKATTNGQTADVFAALSWATGTPNILQADDRLTIHDIPAGDVQEDGTRFRLEALATHHGTYTLGVGRKTGANAAVTVADAVMKSKLYARR